MHETSQSDGPHYAQRSGGVLVARRCTPGAGCITAAVAVTVCLWAGPAAAQAELDAYRNLDRLNRRAGLVSKVEFLNLRVCEPSSPSTVRRVVTDAKRQAQVARYHAMLDAYVAGNESNGVDQASTYDKQAFEQLGRNVLVSGVDPHTPWDGRRHKAAVMVHTDAALRAAGNVYGPETYLQMQAAADFLSLGVRCAPDSMRPFATRWFVLLAALLRDQGALRVAQDLLELGRARFPDDAGILTESGRLAESNATVFAAAGAVPRVGTSNTLDYGHMDETRQLWLDYAVAWFSDALERDPANEDLQLHAGRVHAMARKDDKALRVLGALATQTANSERRYLAELFAAAVHDRAGRLTDAAAAYRRAAAVVPHAHAARVGLADTLVRLNQTFEARDVLRTLATDNPGQVNDPLWWYLFAPVGSAERDVDGLRQEVRQ